MKQLFSAVAALVFSLSSVAAATVNMGPATTSVIVAPLGATAARA